MYKYENKHISAAGNQIESVTKTERVEGSIWEAEIEDSSDHNWQWAHLRNCFFYENVT